MKFDDIGFFSNYFFTCSFKNCRFNNCDLGKSEFSNCKFFNTEFTSSEMVKVSFSDSHFSESKFTQNNLNATWFYRCKFQNIPYDSVSEFENSLFSDCEILKNEQFVKVENSIDFQKFLESD